MRFFATTCTLTAALVALLVAGLRWAGAGYVSLDWRPGGPVVEQLAPAAAIAQPAAVPPAAPAAPEAPASTSTVGLALAAGAGLLAAGLLSAGVTTWACLVLVLVATALLAGNYLLNQQTLVGIAAAAQSAGALGLGLLWRRARRAEPKAASQDVEGT